MGAGSLFGVWSARWALAMASMCALSWVFTTCRSRRGGRPSSEVATATTKGLYVARRCGPWAGSRREGVLFGPPRARLPPASSLRAPPSTAWSISTRPSSLVCASRSAITLMSLWRIRLRVGAHTELTRHLEGRNRFFGARQQIHALKPRGQRRQRAGEQRAGLVGRLFATAMAQIERTLAEHGVIATAAGGPTRSRPATATRSPRPGTVPRCLGASVPYCAWNAVRLRLFCIWIGLRDISALLVTVTKLSELSADRGEMCTRMGNQV